MSSRHAIPARPESQSELVSVLLPGEVAKPIPGIIGYLATDQGRIISLPKRRNRKVIALRPGRSRTYGALSVAVQTNGQQRSFAVHRLVALAFHGEPPIGRNIAMHIDGNPANNAPSNLAWSTTAELDHGKTVRGTRPCGREFAAKISAGMRKAVHS